MDITGIGKIIDGITGFLSSLDLTGEKKAEINARIEQLKAKLTMAAYEDNKASLQADSWLAKNIRPMMAFCIFAIFTGLSFKEKVAIGTLTLWSGLLNSVVGFYFGGRTLEKISRIVSNSPAVRKSNIVKTIQNTTPNDPWDRERSTDR